MSFDFFKFYLVKKGTNLSNQFKMEIPIFIFIIIPKTCLVSGIISLRGLKCSLGIVSSHNREIKNMH